MLAFHGEWTRPLDPLDSAGVWRLEISCSKVDQAKLIGEKVVSGRVD